jgi:hypothetical protein
VKGYVENQITILGDCEKIFEYTNDVLNWSELFDEYETVKVLLKTENEVTFTLRHKNGNEWTSKRITNRSKMKVRGKRMTSMFPFSKMDIYWFYEKLPSEIGCTMCWIQIFNLDESFAEHEVYRMESFLNKNTRKEMKRIKNILEDKWKNDIIRK